MLISLYKDEMRHENKNTKKHQGHAIQVRQDMNSKKTSAENQAQIQIPNWKRERASQKQQRSNSTYLKYGSQLILWLPIQS